MVVVLVGRPITIVLLGMPGLDASFFVLLVHVVVELWNHGEVNWFHSEDVSDSELQQQQQQQQLCRLWWLIF